MSQNPPEAPLVPEGFQAPTGLDHPSFRLRPLAAEHNATDHDAWMSSIEHIRSTPGFVGRRWPQTMSAEDNLRDIRMHEDHFRDRVGFTYTVLAPDRDEVLGCVYLYPDDEGDADVHARSWVRSDHAELDRVLADTVRAWLREDWPFASVRYEER